MQLQSILFYFLQIYLNLNGHTAQTEFQTVLCVAHSPKQTLCFLIFLLRCEHTVRPVFLVSASQRK